jgi:hypothetical protein
MSEGLHRLKRMGCEVAPVGAYSEAANALYFSVMRPEHDISEPWKKIAELREFCFEIEGPDPLRGR